MGLSFDIDPHCAGKFAALAVNPIPEEPVHFEHGHCVWTDADCDGCTGKFGNETVVRWLDPGSVPPSPSSRTGAGHHEVTIEWDNQPEILLNAGLIGGGF